MDSAELTKRIAEIAEPVCAAAGVDLYFVELAGSIRRPTVRIYIDAPAGVSIEDCVEVTKRLSPSLDVEDPINGPYDLEVSSPGLDRPLRHGADFAAHAGKLAKVRLREPLDDRRNFKGRIVRCDEHKLLIEVDGREFSLPLAAIERANLEHEF